MGKNKNNKRTQYSHRPGEGDPRKTRESASRRGQQAGRMAITRLQRAVQRQEELMRHYLGEEEKEKKKKQRLDPNYDLKGAARAALDHYKDPKFDYSETVEVNIYDQYVDGKMWNHVEGQNLLQLMLDLGMAWHNVAERSKEAIKTFKQILNLDKDDHLRSRHALLRCYLDEGMGLEARTLIEEYPEDTSACFLFGMALLDHVAYHVLEEKDSSLEVANQSLLKAFEHHNYAIWIIALYPYFEQSIELLDEMTKSVPGDICPGGILDALLFYEEDAKIWIETDGAVDWIVDFLKCNELKITNPGSFLSVEEEAIEYDEEDCNAPPLVTVVNDKREESDDEEGHTIDNTETKEKREVLDEDNSEMDKTEAEYMYLNMYRTAVKMAASSSDESESKIANKLLVQLNALDIWKSA